MIESFFSEGMRRNPFPFYDKYRTASPLLYLEPFDFWMIFDHDGVKRALEDHVTFSSAAVAPGSTGKSFEWLIFKDPPRHGRLRALVACAFTPRVVASLESRIRQISRELLDRPHGYSGANAELGIGERRAMGATPGVSRARADAPADSIPAGQIRRDFGPRIRRHVKILTP